MSEGGDLTREELRRMREFFQGDARSELVSDPLNWRLHAQRLYRAAMLIADAHARAFSDEDTIPNPASSGQIVVGVWKLVDMEIHLVSVLLYGYAVEVMSKAVLIAQGRVDPSKPENLPRWWGGHDVGAMLKEAEIQLDPREKEIVPLLTDCVQWMGRYPVPSKGAVARSKWQKGYAACSTTFREVPIILEGLYRKLCDAWNSAEASTRAEQTAADASSKGDDSI